MFCESPIKRISKSGIEYLTACRKCRACRARKSNEKMIVGIFAAAEFKKKGQFLTLTYNDEHLPYGLNHADFSNFMKKLRQNTGIKDLKMFMAGEYGEEGEEHREHFHVLFFNHRFPIEEIEKAWTEPRKRGRKRKGIEEELKPLGFVYDGTCTPEAMKYCSGYVAKGGYDPDSDKRPPYGRFSCHLPDNLTNKEIKKICQTGKIEYNGRMFLVPELWRRRYADVWHYWDIKRALYKRDHYTPNYDLTPRHVSDIMDMKARKHALHKAEKKLKRQKRIMSQ